MSSAPVQSTMGELWAVLHFIMPVLFEGHDEYNEWFAKNIESHLENASLMDEGKLIIAVYKRNKINKSTGLGCLIYMFSKSSMV
jgi:SNF2 family DNA or RNA helicase